MWEFIHIRFTWAFIDNGFTWAFIQSGFMWTFIDNGFMWAFFQNGFCCSNSPADVWPAQLTRRWQQIAYCCHTAAITKEIRWCDDPAD